MPPVQTPPGYDPPRTKTPLDVLMQIAQTIGGIATPIILAALTLWGTMFNGQSQGKSTLVLKQEETRARILDAALTVLKTPPDEKKTDLDHSARDWAINVVNGYKVVGTSTPIYLPSPQPPISMTSNASGRPKPPTH
jgi:hypothetical protein